jgi:hypothetical protein
MRCISGQNTEKVEQGWVEANYLAEDRKNENQITPGIDCEDEQSGKR